MGTRNEELKRNRDIAETLVKQDRIMDELKDIRREMLVDRKGREEYEYEDTIEDSDIDLSDIPEKEVDDA